MAKLIKDDGWQLQVREIFASIQGEGPDAGRPAVFIRLTGCHLACAFCDTKWDDNADPILTVDQIVSQACVTWATARPEAGEPFFVVTGGEPTRQNIDRLIDNLFDIEAENAEVQIETSGTFFRDCMRFPFVSTIVSPKTPYVDERVADLAKAYKYIIRASDTFDDVWGLPMNSTQDPRAPVGVRLARPPERLWPEHVYVQPCDEGDAEKNAANMRKCYELAWRFGYRVSLQMHKVMGLD